MLNVDLTGRVAVVTGVGRRIGIGAAICRTLAEQGADIFFQYYQPYDQQMAWGQDADGPAAILAELQAMGRRAENFECDLSQPSGGPTLIAEAERRLGHLSILVNNAAHSVNGGWQELDAAQLDAHYAVNVRATTLASLEFCRRFEAARGGRIINLTSGQSLGPMPDELAYVASKGAVEAFTRSLAAGVVSRGITVNAVNPGPTDTGWMSDDLKQTLLPRFPFGRLGQPADAARLIAFLATDAAEWITGQVIHSEGGFERG